MGVRYRPGWQATLPVGPHLYDYYDSVGDMTISTPTTIATDFDGPVIVKRFGHLMLNASLTVKYPSRGLVLLCETLTIGAAGLITMTGQGAVSNPNWQKFNLSIPDSINIASNNSSRKNILQYIRANNIFVGDPVFWSAPPPGLGEVAGAIAPGVVLAAGATCGVGGKGVAGDASAHQPGVAGAPGTGGGSGGGGSYGTNASGSPQGSSYGKQGTIFGGGHPGQYAVGGGYTAPEANLASPEVRGGGLIVVIARGSISIAAGGKIQANGLPGQTVPWWAASGGGIVVVIGPLTNAGIIEAAGGAATGSPNAPAPGGAGSVITKTWADMGWV